MQDSVVYFMAFVLTAVLVRLLCSFAERFGLLDIPDARKNHGHAVPIVGGIAMVGAFMGLLPFISLVPANVVTLAMALGLMCVAGTLDDLHDLSPGEKFLLQTLSVLIMTMLGGVCVETLGNLFGLGPLHTGPLQVAFTVVCVLGVVNAINMADGVDGLAGSLALVACGWFSLLAWLSGAVAMHALLLLLAGALLGFLAFNLRTPWRSKASVFMGDAGSMSLGLLLAWFAVELSGHHVSKVSPITAVWVLALPLIDMAAVMARRIRKGKSPFAAGHEHLHYMLVHAGYSVSEAVAIKTGLSALLGGIGVAAWLLHVPDYVMFYLFMLLLGLYYYGVTHAWHLMKALRRNPPAEQPAQSAETALDAPLE